MVSSNYRFDYIQDIVGRFWKKWTWEVFPSLVIRPKWHVERQNVKKGDVVFIQDGNAVRGEWKLGIVTNTFPSDDGKIRRVEVSYKNFRPEEKLDTYNGTNYTSVERSVQRLIVLVAADEDEQD